MYFHLLLLQKCNFSQAQYKLPEDGPGGPKHEGANVGNFKIIIIIIIQGNKDTLSLILSANVKYKTYFTDEIILDVDKL
jgi:hypothetical protein